MKEKKKIGRREFLKVAGTGARRNDGGVVWLQAPLCGKRL